MRILKSTNNGKGYLSLILSKNGQKRRFLIHRLVAKAFIPNPNKLLEVNHKNEIKNDNRKENLEWCNAKYNCNYGTRRKKLAKLKSKIVIQIKEGKIINKFNSVKEAMIETGINNISACCRNEYKQSGGYIWKITICQ